MGRLRARLFLLLWVFEVIFKTLLEMNRLGFYHLVRLRGLELGLGLGMGIGRGVGGGSGVFGISHVPMIMPLASIAVYFGFCIPPNTSLT